MYKRNLTAPSAGTKCSMIMSAAAMSMRASIFFCFLFIISSFFPLFAFHFIN